MNSLHNFEVFEAGLVHDHFEDDQEKKGIYPIKSPRSYKVYLQIQEYHSFID